MSGLTAFLLRLAADRWVAAGRPDPYDEWSAELAQLRAEGGAGSSVRRLTFAASLTVSRVPRGGSASARERFAGSGRRVAPIVVPLLLPTVAMLVGTAALRFPDSLMVTDDLHDPHFPLVVVGMGLRLAVLVALVVAFAVVGRAVGARLPLSTVDGATYRLAVTAVGTPALLAVGMGATLAGAGSGSRPPILVAGLAVWTVLTALTVPAVLRRMRSGRRWRPRAWAVLAGLLPAMVTVTIVGLPRMLSFHGGVWAAPLWLPSLLLDSRNVISIGPSFEGFPLSIELEMVVEPLPLLLVTAAAYGLGYALAAARTRVAASPPAPAAGTGTGTARPTPRYGRLGPLVAAVGGLSWLGLVVGVTPLADRLTAAGRGGDDVLLTEVFDLRRLAVLLTCGGLVVALRRGGPAWPAVLTVPALLVADLVVARTTPAAGTATAVVLVTLVACAAAATVAARLLARPGRIYGRWTLPIVGIAAAYLSAVPWTVSDPTLSTPTALVALTVTLGAGLGALATHCLVLVRAPRARRPRRIALTALGAVPVGAAGLFTAAPSGWFELPASLGPFAAVLVALVMYPGRVRRAQQVGLLLAAVPAGVVLNVVAVLVSMAVDATVPARRGLDYDTLPIVAGAFVVAVSLGVALRARFDRPDPPVPASPSPAGPVPVAAHDPRPVNSW